jgi:hypothetical protein
MEGSVGVTPANAGFAMRRTSAVWKRTQIDSGNHFFCFMLFFTPSYVPPLLNLWYVLNRHRRYQCKPLLSKNSSDNDRLENGLCKSLFPFKLQKKSPDRKNSDPGMSLFYPLDLVACPCPRRSAFHPGRSSDSRIILLTAPSHRISNSGVLRCSFPITAAGPSPILTGFPLKPLTGTWIVSWIL